MFRGAGVGDRSPMTWNKTDFGGVDFEERGRRRMEHPDTRKLDRTQAKHVWDVAEYCRRTGIHRAEEKRLIKVLGRYATSHELQMNIVRPQTRTR